MKGFVRFWEKFLKNKRNNKLCIFFLYLNGKSSMLPRTKFPTRRVSHTASPDTIYYLLSLPRGRYTTTTAASAFTLRVRGCQRQPRRSETRESKESERLGQRNQSTEKVIWCFHLTSTSATTLINRRIDVIRFWHNNPIVQATKIGSRLFRGIFREIFIFKSRRNVYMQ